VPEMRPSFLFFTQRERKSDGHYCIKARKRRFPNKIYGTRTAIFLWKMKEVGVGRCKEDVKIRRGIF